ncbi:CGNR zinc finger domain-containing protein [Streptomyces sp. NBC_01476]|uniref:CGNR zinc finger domain-containing protein n=1 Tax=Streptomyces sp. NBC_01476 TaxID=2903881 RepID=UPI002E36E1DD|nr:CGNR zinc finger domain-containing protein [Streptomyces sp. NBC_01476]
MAPKTTAPQRREAAIPQVAVAVVDLLNSRPYANLGDKLDDPRTAAAVLRPFGAHPVEGSGAADRLEAARAIRSDLLALVAAADPADRAHHWAALSGRIAAVTFRQEFTGPGRVDLRQTDGDPVVGGIVQAVAALVAADNWTRIRLCANEECHEAFYDTSRSRTRRWHSYEVCGNRTNVAAYRVRHQQS